MRVFGDVEVIAAPPKTGGTAGPEAGPSAGRKRNLEAECMKGTASSGQI